MPDRVAGSGLLLRYLADAYRALRQTIPEAARTEDIDDLVAWLGELVRQTDSSLLDEWENLANPSELDAAGEDARPVDQGPPPVTRNERAFRVLVRNEMFRRVELFARRSPADLAAAPLGDARLGVVLRNLDVATGQDADALARAATDLGLVTFPTFDQAAVAVASLAP